MMHLHIAWVVALVVGFAPQMALAQQPNAAPFSAGVQLGRLLRDANAALPQYSCDLRKQFNQCRQYVVAPANAEFRVKELSDACESLEGILAQSPCPQEAVIAQCREVKFRRDAVYDASYYQGPPSAWTVEKLQDVCSQLQGDFVVPER